MTPQEFIEHPNCLFCGEALVIPDDRQQYRTCPTHSWNNHQQGNWQYYDLRFEKITSVHAILNEIQISIHFGGGGMRVHTTIYDLHNDGFEEIKEFEDVINLSLEPQALDNKLKTLMLFS